MGKSKKIIEKIEKLTSYQKLKLKNKKSYEGKEMMQAYRDSMKREVAKVFKMKD